MTGHSYVYIYSGEMCNSLSYNFYPQHVLLQINRCTTEGIYHNYSLAHSHLHYYTYRFSSNCCTRGIACTSCASSQTRIQAVENVTTSTTRCPYSGSQASHYSTGELCHSHCSHFRCSSTETKALHKHTKEKHSLGSKNLQCNQTITATY